LSVSIYLATYFSAGRDFLTSYGEFAFPVDPEAIEEGKKMRPVWGITFFEEPWMLPRVVNEGLLVPC